MYRVYLLFGIIIILGIAQLGCVLFLLRRSFKKRRNTKPADCYTDFWNTERSQRIRIYPPAYESEALEGLKPSQILESGNFGLFRYYLIED